MKKSILFLALLPLFCMAQFTYPSGTVIGNQTVIPIPINAPGYAQVQALLYLPDSYAKNPTKKYPVFVFLHGAGEAGSKDITQVERWAAPEFISKGLKPYGIDPATGDTVEWIVISPHCTDNTGCSYSYPQLKYTIPYLLQTYRIDPSCVWVGGLSMGAYSSWSMIMADTAFTMKYITGIMPAAGYGWYDNIRIDSNNLIYAAKHGVACLGIIGDQDQTKNPIGYDTYARIMRQNCQPGKYFDSVVNGQGHTSYVWDMPYPLTARVWSKTMNSWTQMWAMKRGSSSPIIITPPPVILKSVPHSVINIDSSIINYPNSVVHLTGVNSYVTNGKIKTFDYYLDAGDQRVILSQSDSGGICASGLRPGNYRFKLILTDTSGNKDSSYASVSVIGFQVPACPPQRMVTGIQININGLLFAVPLFGTKINYSDGTTQ